MSNQWAHGPGGPGQWGMPQQGAMNQPGQPWTQSGEDSQWGSMQQASLMHQQLHHQYPQQPGYHGYMQGNQQYLPQQTQQQVNQGVHIQEQLARAREEQRAREVELQKRRMMSMNVAEAKPPSSIDTLIGLGDISPATKKKAPPSQQSKPPPVAMTTQDTSKPRSWTMGTSDLQGVFSQHKTEEDSFGEFQAPPPPQPSGVGVVPTSSYTRPIPSVSTGSPVTGQRSRAVSSPHMPRSSGGLNSSTFPPLYTEVYMRCLRDGVLSTQLLFPVLMSSNLPRTKLGELWQLANRETPGKLTQTELFVLLGLIGLTQAGHPCPKFEDLQKAPSPPVPVLEAIKPKAPPTVPVTTQPTDDFGSFQQGPATSVLSFGALSQLPASFGTTFQSIASSFAASSQSAVSSFGTSTPPSVSSFGASTQSAVSSFAASTQPTISSLPTSTVQSSGTQDDKYGAFNDLQSLNVYPPPLLVSSQPATQPSTGDKYAALGSLTTALQPTSSNKQEFGDFKTAPDVQPPVSSQILVAEKSTSDKFAAFGEAKTSQPVPTADFGSFMSTSVQPTSKTVDVSTSSDGGWANFAAAASIPQATSTTPQLDLTVKPASKEGTTASTLDIFEPRPEKKVLSALDILDEEMSARLKSKEDSSSKPAAPMVPESLDDFGDFETFGGGQVNSVPSQQSATEPAKPASDPCEVWRVCLVKCGEVLEKCVGVFGGVEEVGLLTEITESEEGRNRLRGVAEVYRLARRVHSVLRERQSTAAGDCGKTVQTHWSTLQRQLPNDIMTNLYSESQPSDEGDHVVNDVLSDTISTCSLCLIGKKVDISPRTSLDGQREEYPLTLLFHNGHYYHGSCANFWINVVQEPLPVLA